MSRLARRQIARLGFAKGAKRCRSMARMFLLLSGVKQARTAEAMVSIVVASRTFLSLNQWGYLGRCVAALLHESLACRSLLLAGTARLARLPVSAPSAGGIAWAGAGHLICPGVPFSRPAPGSSARHRMGETARGFLVHTYRTPLA